MTSSAPDDGVHTRSKERPLRIVPRQSARKLEVPLGLAHVPEAKREFAERRIEEGVPRQLGAGEEGVVVSGDGLPWGLARARRQRVVRGDGRFQVIRGDVVARCAPGEKLEPHENEPPVPLRSSLVREGQQGSVRVAPPGQTRRMKEEQRR